MTTTKTTKATPEPNGISFMLTDTWTRAQAAQRMQQQCPVTNESIKLQMHSKEDPVEDKILKAWEEAHPMEPVITPAQRAEQERQASLEAPIVKPIPSFADMVRQQEEQGHTMAA